MARKVKITRSPKGSGQGFNSNEAPVSFNKDKYNNMSSGPNVKQTLAPTTKENANVEAEVGEVVVSNFMKDGIPELYVIGGKRHSQGGTPLNLPDNSFVFSRDKKLSLKDPNILQNFGKNKSGKSKKTYTMAELAKQYKLNDFRKTLADDNSDKLQRETSELMIQNYVNKLGALAMVQESKKGFKDGIPALAMGYNQNIGLDPASLVRPPMPQQQEQPMFRYGGQTMQEMNYGGGVGKKRRVRVSLPKKQQGGQTGGQPSVVNSPTKVQNIPDNVVKWDESAEGYDESQIRPGDYIKKADGKWYRAAGYKAAPYEYNFEDSRLTGPAGDLQEPYGRLEQMLTDPKNEKLRADLIAGHKKQLQNTKPNSKTGLSQADIDAALSMSDEEILQNFLGMEKQIMGVNASGIGGKGMDEEDSWDKDRSNYENTVKQLGFDPYNVAQQAGFQATYIAMNDLANDPKHKELLNDFRMAQEGRDDENLSGLRSGSISQIDGWVGNTTIGQAAIYKPVLKDLDIQEADWQDVPEPLEAPTLQAEQEQAGIAPWWLQDIVRTAGAAGDMMRIEKRTPWQAQPGVHLPNPTFFDPTRELAANAEQAAISQQAAGVFGGPQALGARSSAIQGQAAKNAADVLGRYNNLNVQTANQFEMNKSQILNQASLNKANLATQLYDKSVIADQQFDNAKNMARQQLRQGYIDAITNRAQAQVMNDLYPQYNIDPSTGGMMTFAGGRDLVPTNPNQSGLMDKFQSYKNQNPGVSDEVLYKMASTDMGVPQSGANGIDPAFFANFANMMPK